MSSPDAVQTSPCATCRRDISVHSLSGPQLRHLLDYGECPPCARKRIRPDAQPTIELARVTWGEESSEITAVYAFDWLAELLRSFIENELYARRLNAATIEKGGETWKLSARVQLLGDGVVVSFVREG